MGRKVAIFQDKTVAHSERTSISTCKFSKKSLTSNKNSLNTQKSLRALEALEKCRYFLSKTPLGLRRLYFANKNILVIFATR